jgi:hypothetical protein
VDDASKVTSTLNTVVEEARELLAIENEILGPDGAPLAPMMTYQKYVTILTLMIEKYYYYLQTQCYYFLMYSHHIQSRKNVSR